MYGGRRIKIKIKVEERKQRKKIEKGNMSTEVRSSLSMEEVLGLRQKNKGKVKKEDIPLRPLRYFAASA